MIDKIIDKTRLAQQFGRNPDYYHQYAKVQQYAADRLLSGFTANSIPPGKVLEVGCGTGFLSQGLVDLLPEHDLEISDLSPGILQFCQNHLRLSPSQEKRIKFKVLDGEDLENLQNFSSEYALYSLIISSFVLQWFQSPEKTIQSLYSCLKPGGALSLSFPSNYSFPELKKLCSDRQVPYPFNSLPDFKTIVEMLYKADLSCEYRTEWYSETYTNLKAMLDHLKKLGAGLKIENRALSYSQMKKILESTQNSEITMSYHLVFLFISTP